MDYCADLGSCFVYWGLEGLLCWCKIRRSAIRYNIYIYTHVQIRTHSYTNKYVFWGGVWSEFVSRSPSRNPA